MIGVSRNRWIEWLKSRVLGSKDVLYEVRCDTGSIEVYNTELRRVIATYKEIEDAILRIVDNNVSIKLISKRYKPITIETNNEIMIENISGLKLYGDGLVTLKLKDNSRNNILSISNSKYVKLSGLSMYGNLTNVDYESAEMYEKLNDILVNNSTYVDIENNYLTRTYYFPVRVEKSEAVGVKNNIIFGFRDQGISIYDSKDISVHGNYVFNDDIGKGYIGIDAWLSDRVNIFNNIVHDIGLREGFGHGIDSEGSRNVLIFGNIVYNNKVNGIFITDFVGTRSDNVQVVLNMLYGNGIDNYGKGISAENADRVFIENNIAIENQLGIHAKNSNIINIVNNIISKSINQNIFVESSCSMVNIENNYTYGSQNNEGIIVIGSKLVRIISNISLENASNGIDIRDSSDGIISHNTSIDNAWNGIYLSNSIRILVDGNIAYDDRESKDQDFGIMETNGSDYNIIKNNIFHDNLYGNYSISGVHTYCDQITYTSLPVDGIVMENVPILYYDGTTYYLAVWNGQSWLKVALS